MYREESFNRFIEIIKERVPERGKITAVIGGILNMEKESVYRRLRGDVPFIFSEIITLARELDISLDSLIPENEEKSRPFQLKMVDYAVPEENDYTMLEEFLRGLKKVASNKQSEVGGALNILPQSFCLGFSKIYQFYLFKWQYQYGFSDTIKPYRDIEPSQRLKSINKEIQLASSKAAATYLIWDENVFSNLVNDIRYFYSINLITPQEKEELKKIFFLFWSIWKYWQ